MSEGWPDFWIKGKYIELIDTINTVNLIKKIEQIDNITNLGTLDTINTVGTIQKINPQTINSTEYNTVIDLIKKIQQIDSITSINQLNTLNTVGTIQKINPTETENAVIDRIAKIDNVTDIETLNAVNTIGKIQQINPQDTDNVVIDRLKLINTIETVNSVTMLGTINTIHTIDTIEKIKVIHDARIVPNFIQNGSFRTADFTGWIARSANAYVEYDTSYRDYVCVLPNQYDYIGQYLPPLYGEEVRIKIRYRHEVDNAVMRITLHYTDATSEDYNFTASTGGAWYDAVIEPTKKTPLAAIIIYNQTDGSELRITGCEMLRKQLVYQAEKDRTISREGAVVHFREGFSEAGYVDIYTPSSGKKAKVLGWSFFVDADVTVELRFANSDNLIAGLPCKGASAMNLVGLEAPTGDTDESIRLVATGACNVIGWINITEV